MKNTVTIPSADSIDYTLSIAGDKIECRVHSIDIVNFNKRDVAIEGSGFKQKDVEAPDFWSDTAVRIVANKYFRGHDSDRENSVKQLVARVVGSIVDFLDSKDRFASATDKHSFKSVLTHLLYVQAFAFNSPVWFNLGTEVSPQCSACFILGVDDNIESILKWINDESLVFRRGSGAGVNISRIRHKNARLQGGGHASGPLSFANGANYMAGAIKSGGKTRRAAKMLVMNDNHPDVFDFIDTKSIAERVAKALIAGGFSSKFNAEGGAYELAPWQNANNSVSLYDRFLNAVLVDGDHDLVDHKGAVVRTIKARELWRKMGEAAWESGDPGLHFRDTMNRFNTVAEDGEIEASNPCCFTGETLVDTSEGKIRIDELVARSQRGEDLPMAWAFDLESSLPVLRRIVKAWKAGDATKLVRVTTDRGISVLCTPEHRWLKRNGAWVEAQHLKAGDSLRKTARWVNKDRSGRHCLNMRGTESAPNGTVWQNRYMWEQAYGPIPDGMEVHHKNGDPTDDRLSNFELIPVSDHRSEHSAGDENPRFIDVEDHVLVEAWDAVAAGRKRGSGVTPTTWNAHINSNGLKGHLPLAASPTNGGRIQGMPWAEFESKINELRSSVNDRVVSVEFIANDTATSVFDIEVEGVHNFSVTSPGAVHSVVVHNSEYLFINNTSCNLASFNLVRYMIRDGLKRVFNWRAFQRDGLAMYLCLDAIVDISSYPTPEIDETTRKYRTLGAGYANIGGMLMRMGIPYDSDEGRHMIAVITSALQGTMVCNSMKAAEAWGTFDRYEANRDHVDKVILSHYNAQVGLTYNKDDVVWNPWQHYEQTVLRDNTKIARVRNAQFTVVAPTGTIGFMMDVDTTGIEPDFSLVKYKEMVGGGYMTLVNTAMSEGLEVLGYDEETRKAIEAHVTTTGGVVEGAPGLKPEHYGVFDCAVAAFGGTRFIRPEAHIEAMAEAQPFLSGAISKTVNMPESSTVDDILDIYMKSWKLGLKAVAVYRDNCKQSQPLSTSKTTDKGSATVILESAPATSMSYDDMTICKLEAQIKDLKSIIGSLRRGERERLSTSHMGHIHKFTIQGMSGHLTVGFYDDGRIGEVFVEMSKEGSTVGGFLDAWSKAFSLMLQYGAPLTEVLQKFEGSRFEPSGFTLNENIRTCTSVIDYVSRYMKMLSSSAPKAAPMLDSAPGDHQVEEGEDVDDSHVPSNTQKFVDTNGRICSSCGSSNLRQSGACFVCNECGSSTGCG